MIPYSILKHLVIEAFKENPSTQAGVIENAVERLIVSRNLFPEQSESGSDWGRFYREKRISDKDRMNIHQIIWDLIVERVVDIGSNVSNRNWPFIRLTQYGENVIAAQGPTYYDPDGYIRFIAEISEDMSPVIKQYAAEAVRCFQSQYLFAAAVMVGAAAETAVILLAEKIAASKKDLEKKEAATKLIERSRLPEIFCFTRNEIEELIKNKILPYAIHQSCITHLLSLFEMIRVQRNDSVHPTAGEVSKTKILITINTFPLALENIYRLIEWFEEDEI